MKNHYKILFAFLIIHCELTIVNFTSAQVDTSISKLSFTGYAEVYYSYDFSQPDNHTRPAFFYNHNRHNEFNLNLGYVKAAYNSDRVRANFALAAGTYMNANYITEPGVLKNIFEANAGLKLCKNSNLWLDLGVFSSHLGFESSISKDCWTLTRCILIENSPGYESGAKLTYINGNGKWLISALILNGWQHIQRPDGNNLPSFGTQITFTPNSNITLNYSTFIGSEKPDTAKQYRYFQNFYGIFNITNSLHVTAGFDFGAEQKSEGSNKYNSWYSPVFIAKINLDNTWSFTGRAEYYRDEFGVIIPTGTSNGFQTLGFSANLDCQFRPNAFWRLEGRMLNSKDKIFLLEDRPSKYNYALTTSIAVSF